MMSLSHQVKMYKTLYPRCVNPKCEKNKPLVFGMVEADVFSSPEEMCGSLLC